MSVNVETLEKNLVKLTVEVPVEDVEKSIEKVYQKEKNKIQLPVSARARRPAR